MMFMKIVRSAVSPNVPTYTMYVLVHGDAEKQTETPLQNIHLHSHIIIYTQ